MWCTFNSYVVQFLKVIYLQVIILTVFYLRVVYLKVMLPCIQEFNI